MPTPHTRPVPRSASLLGLLLATLVAAAFALVGASPAGAHSDLQSSSPAAGEELKELPTKVVLTFNEKVQPGFSQVAVVDGEGLPVTDGDPVAKGATVTQELIGQIHPGSYVITYKVVSADGHPISDAIPFTIAESARGSSGSATTSASQTPADSPSTTPPATESTSAVVTSAATTSTTATASTSGGGVPATWFLVGLGVLVLAGSLLSAALLRSRGPRA